MKHLILDSKWLAPGRAVSAGEVRDDLSEDEGKLLRTMGAATADKGMIERAEQRVADDKAAKREQAAAKPATEKAAK